MRQKFAVTIADVHMNISCDESQEDINAAVTLLDEKIRALLADVGTSCTKTEAAMLLALDYCTRCTHAEKRIKELEDYVSTTDPNGENFGASLLRGENEMLRAELAVSRGMGDAILQDNATLYSLHTKSEKQSADANARADRMHNQVLALMTEVQHLRGQLAAVCVETKDLAENYGILEPVAPISLSENELEVTKKYAQMDLGSILETAPKNSVRGENAPQRIVDLLDVESTEDGAQ